MTRACLSFLRIFAVALVAAGCGGELTTREKGTLGGAALGAASGALVGGAVGSPGTGAAIGAGVGAVGGARVGGALQEREREAEAQRQQAPPPPPTLGAGAPGVPPQFAVVPGSPVYYAPALPADYFWYDGRYYLFQDGTWYHAPSPGGGWVVLAVEAVPQPVLRVPVAYYKAPPGHWKQHGPPPWAPARGHRQKW